MAVYTVPLQILIDELGRLPGIGPKSAQRIAFHLLRVPRDDAVRLADAIVTMKERTTLCRRCFNVAEGELCSICEDPRRDASVVCVVEDPRDAVAVEKTREFAGRYHVLGGALSPIEGVGPDQLRIKELLARIEPEGIREVIICTNPNLEGETTAMYLAKLLGGMNGAGGPGAGGPGAGGPGAGGPGAGGPGAGGPVKVTRIASGLPVGGDLEYADELTLGRALEGRRELSAG